MTKRPLCALVLAAGQGKRLQASVPKVLVEVCGRALVEHVLEALAPLEARPQVIVYGHGGDLVQARLADRGLEFAHQPEQRGTGHAVQCGLQGLDDFEGDVLILCGDTPLLSAEVLQEFVDAHGRSGRVLTVLSADLPDPGSLGRVLRDAEGRFLGIRERADASPAELRVTEINTGVIAADARVLREKVAELRPENAQGEYYLTDVPELLRAEGRDVGVHVTRDAGAALGVNTPEDLAEAVRLIQERIVARHTAAGVQFQDPGTSRIDANAEIGAGTRIDPFVTLEGSVRVGRDARVESYARLGDGVVLGAGVQVQARADLRNCTVGAGSTVGAGALVDGAAIGVDVVVGAGARLVSTPDASGARVVVGDGARVGAGALLVAPVTVIEGGEIPPGEVRGAGAGAREVRSDGD